MNAARMPAETRGVNAECGWRLARCARPPARGPVLLRSVLHGDLHFVVDELRAREGDEETFGLPGVDLEVVDSNPRCR